MFSLRRGLVSLCVLVALLPPVASKHTVDSNAFSAQDAKSAQDVIDSAGIQNAFEDVHEALHDMVYSKLLDAEHPKVSSTLLISPTNRALGRFVDLTTAVFGLDARHVLTLDVSDPRLATEKINKNLFKFIDRYQQEQHLIVVKGAVATPVHLFCSLCDRFRASGAGGVCRISRGRFVIYGCNTSTLHSDVTRRWRLESNNGQWNDCVDGEFQYFIFV